ncbi:MAG: acyl-CoA dehydrogenase family protein [Bradyrhizobium sp.]
MDAGFKEIMTGFNRERIMVAARWLGHMQAALNWARDYATTRQQFGRPIGANQSIAFSLAQAHVDVEATRHLTYHAAERYDSDIPLKDVILDVSSAKLLATQAVVRVTQTALHIAGGWGLTARCALRSTPWSRPSPSEAGESSSVRLPARWACPATDCRPEAPATHCTKEKASTASAMAPSETLDATERCRHHLLLAADPPQHLRHGTAAEGVVRRGHALFPNHGAGSRLRLDHRAERGDRGGADQRRPPDQIRNFGTVIGRHARYVGHAIDERGRDAEWNAHQRAGNRVERADLIPSG